MIWKAPFELRRHICTVPMLKSLARIGSLNCTRTCRPSSVVPVTRGEMVSLTVNELWYSARGLASVEITDPAASS
jgi:hypothetical protein